MVLTYSKIEAVALVNFNLHYLTLEELHKIHMQVMDSFEVCNFIDTYLEIISWEMLIHNIWSSLKVTTLMTLTLSAILFLFIPFDGRIMFNNLMYGTLGTTLGSVFFFFVLKRFVEYRQSKIIMKILNEILAKIEYKKTQALLKSQLNLN